MYNNIGKIVRLNPINHKKSEPFMGKDLKIVGVFEMQWMKSFGKFSNLRYICKSKEGWKIYCNPNQIIFH